MRSFYFMYRDEKGERHEHSEEAFHVPRQDHTGRLLSTDEVLACHCAARLRAMRKWNSMDKSGAARFDLEGLR